MNDRSTEWDWKLADTGAIEQLESGHYQSAIRTAFTVLEERVRQKGEYDLEEFGTNLMKQAFRPGTGKLSFGETSSEREGVMFLYAGAFQALRNPSSHRFLEDLDEQQAIGVLYFVNLLLRLLEENTEGAAEWVSGEIPFHGHSIEELLDAGESETVEFKRQIPNHVDTIAKELAALANSQGGTLIIGANDDGSVHGLEDINKTVERVSSIVRAQIDPPLHPRIETRTIDGQDILILSVQSQSKRPAGVDGIFYKRVGTTVNKLSSDELADWFS